MASVISLSRLEDNSIADLLLREWNGYSPKVRREVMEALFTHPDRLSKLLTAKISPSQIESVRIQQLRKHSNSRIRRRAEQLFANYVSLDRKEILKQYQASLKLKPNPERGRMLFQKNCATCHRLENKGVEAGPDLVAVLRNESPEDLLLVMLDPSREVDPRYVNYKVRTKRGRTVTGMISTETGSSITLRRAEKVEETILRNQIEQLQTTWKSLMPEGLEKQLKLQDVADLIAYLQKASVSK